MADKQLKSMDKMQLLNIMLTQENEISRLNAAIQAISAEKNSLAMSLEETRTREHAVSSDHQNEIAKLSAALQAAAAEKESLEESLEEARSVVYTAPEPAADSEEISRLSAELQAVTAEKELLAKSLEELRSLAYDVPEPAPAADAEEINALNAVIADLNAEIRTLAGEKEELEKTLMEQSARDTADPFDKASQAVSEIMRSAQDSADMYLRNIKRLENEKVTVVRKIEDEANEKAGGIITAANEKAEGIIKAAEYRCREIEDESQTTVEDLRAVSRRYIDFVDSAHAYMHEMIENYRLLDPQANEAEDDLYDQIQRLRTGDNGQ